MTMKPNSTSYLSSSAACLLLLLSLSASACGDSSGPSGLHPDGGNNVALGVPLTLGAAGGFVILAKSGIATVPTSAVTGNLGVSPAAGTSITGFSPTADSTNVFSTSPQVTGKIYASDFSAPTPTNLTAAIADMQLAFTDAAGRAPSVTELGAGNVGGMTLVPGVYQWGTGLQIPGDVTLNGSGTAVWIFQVA
ncbi:MAG TPA: ice-binding family protein, partial [Polyangia bacterium]|nr:ice-binding family protein [Polyangia bacterium]